MEAPAVATDAPENTAVEVVGPELLWDVVATTSNGVGDRACEEEADDNGGSNVAGQDND